MNDTCHLYTDLAWLWPMWGDAASEYAHYCQHVTSLIQHYAKRQTSTLLDMACEEGKNVLNLKRQFNVTSVDLSPTMLEQAKELNPECPFVQGDIRTVRLALCDASIIVNMPGGDLAIRFSKDFAATMTGPVTRVCQGVIDPEMFMK